MINISLPVLFAALAALASANATADVLTVGPITTVTRFGSVTTTFSCGSNNPAACNYLILNSVCQEKLFDNGMKEKSCRYTEAVPPFQIKAGESKTIANLTADYLYTMKVGAVPSSDDCLKAPMPH
jgi:hypothetical protein